MVGPQKWYAWNFSGVLGSNKSSKPSIAPAGYVYILRCDIEMEMHNVSETDSLNDSLNTKVLFEVHQTHLVWARDNGLATLY